MNGPSPVPGSLSISSAREAGTVQVTLAGELDLANAKTLEEHLFEASQNSPARVIIDLGRLAFIDSTGLRLLLQADARAREHGYEFLLRPGEASVQRVFEITGALDVLNFQDASES
jgi:anti-anti-sigma factor